MGKEILGFIGKATAQRIRLLAKRRCRISKIGERLGLSESAVSYYARKEKNLEIIIFIVAFLL